MNGNPEPGWRRHLDFCWVVIILSLFVGGRHLVADAGRSCTVASYGLIGQRRQWQQEQGSLTQTFFH